MDIRNIVIAGTGVMGASIAQVCAQGGYNVFVYGRTENSLEKGRNLVHINQEVLIKNGLVSQKESEAATALIHFTSSLDCVKDADLICESIVERLESKKDFFRSIEVLLKKNALVTTNTSGLSINAIAEGVADRTRFAGMHWVNPPHLIPLVEIIRGLDTTAETIADLTNFLHDVRKKPILVNKDIPGFVLNRLQFAVLREALHLVQSGAASAQDIDSTFKYALGIRYACLGPFEIADIGGLDTFNLISQYLFADLDDSKKGSTALAQLVAKGKLGVKAGAGFYDYSEGKAEEVIKKRDESFISVVKALHEQR